MADGFNTIKEFIDYLSEKYTTRAAYKFIVDESVESRTYNQLKADSYSLASFLVNKGYNHNHIAILGGTSYDWIVSFFAVVISGNVVIPIDRMLSEKEMLFLFEKGDETHAHDGVVVGDEHLGFLHVSDPLRFVFGKREPGRNVGSRA